MRDAERKRRLHWPPEAFFHLVRDSKLADILIGEPPRRLMNQGLEWQPSLSPPIENVLDQFNRGICRVRHNLAHGEKFSVTGSGWNRDIALVTQALWVLERALEKGHFFESLSAKAKVQSTPA